MCEPARKIWGYQYTGGAILVTFYYMKNNLKIYWLQVTIIYFHLCACRLVGDWLIYTRLV